MPRNEPLGRALALYQGWREGQFTCEETLQRAVFAELEPFEQDVLRAVVKKPYFTSAELVRQFHCEINLAGTVLKRLYDLGLLTRTERREVHGRCFVYQASDLVRLLKL